MGAILKRIWDFFYDYRGGLRRGSLRFGALLLTLFIAGYPVLQSAHIALSGNLDGMASAANDANNFRELFYITVIMVAFSLTSIFEKFARGWDHFSTLVLWLMGMSGLIYVGCLVAGAIEFAEMVSAHAKLTQAVLSGDMVFAERVLGLVFFTEVVLAAADGR